MKRRHHISMLVSAILCTGIACVQPMWAQTPERDDGHSSAYAIEPSETESGFIHLELPGVFSRNFTVRFVGDTLFLPFTAFLNSLGILNSIADDLNTLAGEMPLGQPFAIILSSGKLRRRGVEETLPSRSIAIVDDEVFVESRTLARCVHIQMSFDLFELRLDIVPDTRIPAVARARNRHLYATLDPVGRSVPAAGTTIHRELLGSAAIRWGLLHTIQSGETSSSGLVQIAGPFMFGVLTASGSGRYGSIEQKRITGGLNSIGWQIQFPEFGPLRQMSVEATRSADLTSVQLRLGNAPLGGRREFGMHTLDGHTQPGWDVELYQEQTLVEVTQADEQGAYHFQVPLGYGSATRTIHHVGPHGERLVEQRMLRLNPTLIPPGEIQYNTSLFSESIRLDKSVRGDMNIAFGIFNWMTLGSLVSIQSPDIHALRGDSVNVTALSNFWLGDATPLGVYYNLRSGSVGGSITYTFSDNFAVQAGIDSFNLRRRDAIIANGSFNLGLGWLSLGSTGQLLRNDLMTAVTVSPQLSFYLGGIGINSRAKLAWLKPRAALGGGPSNLSLTTSLQLTAAPLNGLFMMARTSYDHTANIFTDLDISSSIMLASALSLGLSYNTQRMDWTHGTVYAQLGYSFGGTRISVGETYQNGEFATVSSLEGGMVISRGGVQSTSYEAIHQAVVVLHAFHDANLNGIQDDNEEILSDVSADLVGNGGLVHTDNGIFLSLSPYQQSTVMITHERFAGRGLYPRRSEYGIYTLPGTSTVIDVPYAEGFDATGHCRIRVPSANNVEASTTILTALKIRLIATNGSAEYEGEIFDDGSILIEGVSEGQYRIVFDEQQLISRKLQLSDDSPPIFLNSTKPSLPTLIFVPRESTSAIPAAVASPTIDR